MALNYKRRSVLAARILGFVLFIPLRIVRLILFRSSERNADPKRILIQDGYRLGDLLMLMPAGQFLRARFPRATIDIITSAAGCCIVDNLGVYNHCISYDAPWAFPQSPLHSVAAFFSMARTLAKTRYDSAFDFQADPRGCACLFFAGIPELISFPDLGASPWCSRTVAPPPKSFHQVERYNFLLESVYRAAIKTKSPFWPQAHATPVSDNRAVPNRPYVLIHPGASRAEKNWGDEHFVQLVNEVTARGYAVVVAGGKPESALLDIISKRCGESRVQCLQPSLDRFRTLVEGARAVVCNDSFAAQAAWALATPVLVMFGPTDPRMFAPQSCTCSVGWNDSILTWPFADWTGPAAVGKTTLATVTTWIDTHVVSS